MKTSIYLDNIKCHGCSNTIAKKIKQLGFEDFNINIEEGSIEVEHENDENLESLKKELKKLGYPEQGTSNLTESAKSYVSCMIGRIKPE